MEGDNKPSGGLSGLVGHLFAYIDTPWKAVAVIALFIVGGAGWVLYEQRAEIIEAWLTPSAVGLRYAEIPQALEKLEGETGADLTQIWAVDLGQNAQWFVAARLRDGTRPVIPTPRRLPIIVTTSDAQVLVDVLNGFPICVPVTEQGSPLARRLAARGMRRGCAIPIPPTATAFVGVIYLAWTAPPEPSVENVAVGAAREIAAQLVSR